MTHNQIMFVLFVLFLNQVLLCFFILLSMSVSQGAEYWPLSQSEKKNEVRRDQEGQEMV